MKWYLSDKTYMANMYGSRRKHGTDEKYTLSGNPEGKVPLAKDKRK